MIYEIDNMIYDTGMADIVKAVTHQHGKEESKTETLYRFKPNEFLLESDCECLLDGLHEAEHEGVLQGKYAGVGGKFAVPVDKWIADGWCDGVLDGGGVFAYPMDLLSFSPSD